MDPDIKAAWIADLRFNPGHQGKIFLRSVTNKYSALGRLHQVVGGGWGALSGDRNAYYLSDMGDIAALSPATITLTGLSSTDIQTIVFMNDFDNKTFFDIADWIEGNL